MPEWPAAATARGPRPPAQLALDKHWALLSVASSSPQSHLSGECYQGLLPGLLAAHCAL